LYACIEIALYKKLLPKVLFWYGIIKQRLKIDQSDFCLFYYDENYLPPKRKWAKRDLFEYQPQSGTALAYKYAQQKKKNIKKFL